MHLLQGRVALGTKAPGLTQGAPHKAGMLQVTKGERSWETKQPYAATGQAGAQLPGYTPPHHF